jgi:hypothetical protein
MLYLEEKQALVLPGTSAAFLSPRQCLHITSKPYLMTQAPCGDAAVCPRVPSMARLRVDLHLLAATSAASAASSLVKPVLQAICVPELVLLCASAGTACRLYML